MGINEVTYDMKHARIRDLFGTIKTLSDVVHQENVWVKQTKPDHWWDTWEENMCMFFDSHVDSLIGEEVEEYGFTDLQLKQLAKLHDLIRKYSDSTPQFMDPKVVLADPEWHKVVEQAKITLKAFEGYEVPKD